jgi:hypothetical protein
MRRLDRFISNIGLNGINVLQLPKVSEEYNKIIQREALKFFKTFKLVPGVLPGSLSGGYDVYGKILSDIPSGIFNFGKAVAKGFVEKTLDGIGEDKLRDVGIHMANNVIKNIQRSQKRADKAKAAAAPATGGNIFFHRNPTTPTFLDVAQNTEKMLHGGSILNTFQRKR